MGDFNLDDCNPTSPLYVLACIVISLGLPLTLAAIYSLYTQVSSDHVAPIYVINLLLSDLIQLCLMITWLVKCKPSEAVIITYLYFLGVSVGFMVCVAMERYLVIVHPLWYRCRRTIKSTVVVCVVVWLIPLVYILPLHSLEEIASLLFCILLLLPLPLLIFFLVATVKALSASISVPLDEKRRIVGVLVLVLLIYMLLFLPAVMTLLIWLISETFHIHGSLFVPSIFLELNPLADLVLYVFMRKGAVDKLLAAVCCCRLDSSDTSSSAV